MNAVVFRDIELKDLDLYLYWKSSKHEHNKYNGPYFKQNSDLEMEKHIDNLKRKLKNGERNLLDNKKIVVDKKTDEVIGEVNWYWRSEETLWMEIGLVIFNSNYWGKGLGVMILTQWIDELFCTFPRLARLGLSTWSGNTRMINLSKKIGLKQEALYRKARIVDGKYYDSVSYGILREEWDDRK